MFSRARERYGEALAAIVLTIILTAVIEAAEQHRREVEFARQIEAYVRGASE